MTMPTQPVIESFPDMPDDTSMLQLMKVVDGQLVTIMWLVSTDYMTMRDALIQGYGTPMAECVMNANASAPAINTMMSHPETQVVFDD